MALTRVELATIRQRVAKLVGVVTYDKPAINGALQALELLAPDPVTFIDVTVSRDTDVEAMQTAFDAGNIPAVMRPLVRKFLADNPTETRRTTNRAAVAAWIQANDVSGAVVGMPVGDRQTLVKEWLTFKVEGVR